jgi:hypothetical protein
MMVTLGGIGHFVLIIACLAALFHQTTEDRKWWSSSAEARGRSYISS